MDTWTCPDTLGELVAAERQRERWEASRALLWGCLLGLVLYAVIGGALWAISAH